MVQSLSWVFHSNQEFEHCVTRRCTVDLYKTDKISQSGRFQTI